MKRILVLVLFLQAAAAQSGVVAIRGARVIDGTGAPARAATVVWRDRVQRLRGAARQVR